MKYYSIIITCLLLVLQMPSRAQTAYEHVSNTTIYNFIDELATMQLIDVTTAIKPYSRHQIAGWLTEAGSQREKLSQPQQAMLDLYLREYALEAGQMKEGIGRIFRKDEKMSLHLLPPEFVWRDSVFSAIIRPIYGIRYFASTNNNFYHSYGGLEGIFYIGKRWAVYASLRDNYQNKEILSRPTFFTQEQGGNYKVNEGGREGGDFSEMRGGISYTWDWGSFGLYKEHFQWGDNSNGSNILSGRTPSFAAIKLDMNPAKWFEFNFFHGWLVSEVIDSVRSYTNSDGSYRARYREKYIASNMFTFKPFKRLHVSIGNAIIYSDIDVQPAYMTPFFFFKSIDHTINHGIDNQNSMMFINVSSRQIKHLHLYFSMFVDEFSTTRVTDPTRHNFISYKGGLSLASWPLAGLVLNAEFTRSTPNTFEHYNETTTYATNLYNLGHYLRGNSQEIFASIRYSVFSTLQVSAEYNYAMHGNDYPYSHNLGIPVDEFPVLEEKSWDRSLLAFKAQWLPVPNIRVFAEYSLSNAQGYDLDGISAQSYLKKFTPSYLHGSTQTLIMGFGIGF